MKTINQRNKALLKLQSVHAKCAGEPKILLKPGEKPKFPWVQCAGTQTLCTTDHVNYSGPVIHAFHCLGWQNMKGSLVFTKIERKVTIKYRDSGSTFSLLHSLKITKTKRSLCLFRKCFHFTLLSQQGRDELRWAPATELKIWTSPETGRYLCSVPTHPCAEPLSS